MSLSSTSPRTTQRRRPRALAARIGLVALLALAAGCQVPPPTLEQVMRLGYMTPEQAYESWRTAIQGGFLVEEYQSLSKGWRRRHGDGVSGLSLFAYSEGRDALFEERPLARLALKRAEPPQWITRGPNEALLQARIRGPLWFSDHWLIVRLVREGFTAVHTQDDPERALVTAREVDLLGAEVLSATTDGEDATLEARVRVPADTDEGTVWPRDVALLRVGWEWKVDDFDVLPAPVAPDAAFADS